MIKLLSTGNGFKPQAVKPTVLCCNFSHGVYVISLFGITAMLIKGAKLLPQHFEDHTYDFFKPAVKMFSDKQRK